MIDVLGVSAIVSPCGQYRYSLHRDVDMFGQHVFAFFGINPSTADANSDDNTVKKWIGFSGLNNCRQFLVGNVFAYRATKVSTLSSVDDPIGHENDAYLRAIIQSADVLVPCWGSRQKLPSGLWCHVDAVMATLIASGKPIKCFGQTRSGDPRHPLMIGYGTPLLPFEHQKYG